MSTQNTSEADERSHNLATQGTVVATFTMVSRISGLVRDVFFSYLLGASHFADIFLVAFRIPNFFRRMFAEGAFNQAFVPVLVRFKTQGHAELLAFLAPLSGIFSAVMMLVVVLGLLLAPQLAFIFAPGFADYPHRLEQTAALVYVTFPYLALISLTAYAGAVLNAHNQFAVPAATPVLLNLVLIGAAVLAVPLNDGFQQIQFLAWGVLAAGFIQLAFQMPSMARLGVLTPPTLNHRHEGVRRVGRLLVPALFASSVGQINALVNTILASTLITGSISWLYYADRLLELPVGLVAIALSTVMLPHLSRLASEGEVAWFQHTVTWGINVGLMLCLPAAVALYLMADGLIATIFMSFTGGAMTPYDARMAGLALEMFAVALPGFVLVRVLSPAFFAHEDTRTPFRCAMGSVAANLLVSLATFSWFGHVGLAWATAIAAWTNVILLYFALKRHGLYVTDSSLWPLLWRTVVASILLAGALALVQSQTAWLEQSPMERLVGIVVIVGVGLVGYLIVLLLLGVRPKHLNHYSATQGQ